MMIIEKVSGERFTPFSLARKFGAKAALESASFSDGQSRYSMIMLDEAFRVEQTAEGVSLVVDGQRHPIYMMGKDNGDILDVLEMIAAENPPAPSCPFDFPLPQAGIGYLSYEFCARCDTIHLNPQCDELAIPEASFIVGHTFIVFDHFNQMLYICAQNYKEHKVDLAKAVAAVKKRMNDLDFSYMAESEEKYTAQVLTDEAQSKAEYTIKVNALKKRIAEGDIIQAVPSRRLRIKSDIPALEVYRRLRLVNPSPYLFYLDFGDFAFTGASPESLITVRNRQAVIHPIAGTRRRGADAYEDELLKQELLHDPKERAEHLMLVDLARNDLGRVCRSGSVKVTRFMQTELFSHVIHMVSEVTGYLSDGVKATEALRAAFPAGTVSGAPKISAIEILSALEPARRNFYAGAVGYLTSTGDLDYCIALRCAVKKDGVWNLQAGGGIVNDSNAEREFTETCEKLAAMRTVIEGE